MTQVVNIKRGEMYDVYIGRPSKWGNPFKLERNETREQAIAKYRRYILGRAELMADIGSLRGKRLGCYCAPLSCHGDILAALAGDTGLGEEMIYDV